MARSYSVSVERSGQADAETAFDLLRDATTWKCWAGPSITSSGWRDESPTGDSVVGRVRLVGTDRFKTAEQITDDERPILHGYRILANWPVKDYQARVVLTPGPEGQLTVTWSADFTERIPCTGILWRRFLTRFLGSLAKHLLAHAEVTQRA
ncbi:SRPBCC family protein [Mycolicibacterium sp. P9-64]|uniref:SRPBCC family protein n=1 Tax=Mycolicibacterium sp. P9-64 TaxID=2024612 RepID=UPI0011EEB521|nr:SRPBCC family protein [Mycolicibacterium sp. P9-64]KAA0079103.1 SRPBCC family protein [Mycolicibacterium sp. P9-64]